ncbi:[cytidine(C)-cytidine(C)-adenosine (A)]-adding enzyme [Cohnella sp. 56]|uniref:[cytidine(C)-cytidine(C)-adenosine (A)]-adding enzyme n=1 Tax=Cohnella sp. 56 TaxID=3113722 RepID=UPI0030E9DE26
MKMRYGGRLWTAALEVLDILKQAGCEAYFVGGCVRDELLGRAAHDIDIATSAAPDRVLSLFPDALPTGLKHGTVTVRRSGFFFEVTTFRQDAEYSDGRRPDDVRFVTDVREDLARRDFTINAMAAGTDGFIVDPFGGIDDLRGRTVRTVGDPVLRFGEDALRVLRCVRFAAEFGFAIDAAAWEGMRRSRERLALIAMERVGAELDKVCAGRDPGRAFELLLAAGLPERFKAPLPRSWLDGLRRVAGCGDSAGAPSSEGKHAGLSALVPSAAADPDMRWAALFIAGRAEPDEAEEALRRLHYATRRIRRVTRLLHMHRLVASDTGAEAGRPALVHAADEAAWRRRWTLAVLECGAEAAADWLSLFADGELRTSHAVPDMPAVMGAGWTAAMPALDPSGLAVRGDQLAAASGRPPGPWIAAALRELLAQVATGELSNDREALIGAYMRGADEQREER